MDGMKSKTAGRRERPAYPFGKDVPEAGDTYQVAPGILWLRMPLPFSLEWINIWLIEDGDGWTLVDTGMPTDAGKAAWRTILALSLIHI